MTLYAVRQRIADPRAEDLANLRTSGDGSCEPLAGYWTPADGELFSVVESEPGARPHPPGDAAVLTVQPITAGEYGPPAATSAAEGDDLKLVLVRRKLDPLTQSEFKAIAFQAILCAYEYTDMRWLRSYWARETDQLFCLFETKSHDLIREHAERSRIPCDEVLDAVEIELPPHAADA